MDEESFGELNWQPEQDDYYERAAERQAHRARIAGARRLVYFTASCVMGAMTGLKSMEGMIEVDLRKIAVGAVYGLATYKLMQATGEANHEWGDAKNMELDFRNKRYGVDDED